MQTIRYILAGLVLFLATLHTSAGTTDASRAESLYAEGRYSEALQAYRKLSAQGQGAELYYNIANCYFRLDSIPQALLWYERAYLLSPGDGDIRHNLQYARTKTIDKIVPEEEIFFVRWYRSTLNLMSVEGWTITGILFFALSLAAICMYFFLSQVRLRKLGFYGCIILLVMVLLSNLFAWQVQDRQLHRNRAIVFQPSVSCMSSPNQAGKELYLLHEGTTVSIIDSSVRNWYQIRLSDGKQGWIPAVAVEVI